MEGPRRRDAARIVALAKGTISNRIKIGRPEWGLRFPIHDVFAGASADPSDWWTDALIEAMSPALTVVVW